MARLSVLTCAAVLGLAGIAQAQSSPPPLDANGRPFVGAQNWHAEPGDFTREEPGLQPPDGSSAHTYHQQAMAPMMDSTAHATAFKDEYGFRYDAQGDRIDRHGHVMSPHNPNPNR